MIINQRMKRLKFRFWGSLTTVLCNTLTSTAFFIHMVYFPKIDYMWVRNMLIWGLHHRTTRKFWNDTLLLGTCHILQTVLVLEAPKSPWKQTVSKLQNSQANSQVNNLGTN